MKKILALLALFAVLAGVLAGCGTTPQPTIPPPTQTPWIIVVTATPGAERVAEAQPTQTPWIIVATPTRTAKASPTVVKETASPATSTAPSSTASATATARPTARPTLTPSVDNFKYSAPVLTDPADGSPFGWKSTVLMTWTFTQELAEDEYYRLDLKRPPLNEAQKWYGDYVFTKDTQYLAEGAFLAPFHFPAGEGNAVVSWSVRIVRQTGVDENGKPIGVDLSLPSEERAFTLEPKPDDA
jgi:hypothetical protein